MKIPPFFGSFDGKSNSDYRSDVLMFLRSNVRVFFSGLESYNLSSFISENRIYFSLDLRSSRSSFSIVFSVLGLFPLPLVSVFFKPRGLIFILNL